MKTNNFCQKREYYNIGQNRNLFNCFIFCPTRNYYIGQNKNLFNCFDSGYGIHCSYRNKHLYFISSYRHHIWYGSKVHKIINFRTKENLCRSCNEKILCAIEGGCKADFRKEEIVPNKNLSTFQKIEAPDIFNIFDWFINEIVKKHGGVSL